MYWNSWRTLISSVPSTSGKQDCSSVLVQIGSIFSITFVIHINKSELFNQSRYLIDTLRKPPPRRMREQQRATLADEINSDDRARPRARPLVFTRDTIPLARSKVDEPVIKPDCIRVVKVLCKTHQPAEKKNGIFSATHAPVRPAARNGRFRFFRRVCGK